MEENTVRLNRIKQIIETHGAFFTFEDDLKWLVEQAEQTATYKEEVQYWKEAHKEDCAKLQARIDELE